MQQSYYIGIDGGGTKTKIQLESAAGERLAQTRGGPANIHVSLDTSWQSIHQGIADVLSQAGLSGPGLKAQVHVGLGLAGTEDDAARQAFLATPHPYQTLQLWPDSFAACVGGHSDDATHRHDGAIIIIGTGIVGWQVEGAHDFKTSGWGFPFDDEGAGAWLGLEVSHLTLKMLDRRIAQSTPLLAAVMQYFNNDKSRFLQWLHQAKATDFAKLAPIVVDHIEQKDPYAINLIQRSAAAVDCIASTLQQNQVTDQVLNCCLFGGLAPFVKPWLSDALQQRIVPRKHGATQGALFLIRDYVKGC